MKKSTQARKQKGCVIVTGGCGFLGSHLCEHYLREGYRVVAVDNLSTARPENVGDLKKLAPPGRLLVVRADCAKPWTWAKKVPAGWLRDLETILHFASPASPPLYQRLALETMWVNSIGVAEALALADRRGARLVFASTSEIYGDPAVSPQPETYFGNVNSVGVRSCYDEAKRFGESLIHTHNLKHGTRHGFVRIFNTYGPRLNRFDGRVVINFLKQASENRPLTVFGDGRQTRSFCYVDDLVRGIVLYAAKKTLAVPVNLGNPREITMLELAGAVRALFPDRQLELKHLPLPSDDPQRRKPDIRRASKVLRWEPTVSLNEGLRRTLSWLQANH